MTSVRDICIEALNELQYFPANETPAAADVETARVRLNRMLRGWKADGVDVGLTVDLELADDFPMGAEHEEGVIALLAKRVAPAFNIMASQETQARALDGWQRILATYVVTPDASFDKALTRLPSRRWPYSVPSSETS